MGRKRLPCQCTACHANSKLTYLFKKNNSLEVDRIDTFFIKGEYRHDLIIYLDDTVYRRDRINVEKGPSRLTWQKKHKFCLNIKGEDFVGTGRP